MIVVFGGIINALLLP